MPLRAITFACAIAFALGMPALAASKTSVVLFSVWSGNGLREGFAVTAKASGFCWSHSLVTDRNDAWRCFRGDDILDPCFARSRHSAIVACAEDPFSKHLVLLSLKKPLPNADNPTTQWLQPKGLPWGLRLTKLVRLQPAQRTSLRESG